MCGSARSKRGLITLPRWPASGSRRRVSSGIELASLIDQARSSIGAMRFVDGGAPGLAVADRPAQVVVGFVDRGVLAVRLPFDQDGQCPWELPMPLMFRQISMTRKGR